MKYELTCVQALILTSEMKFIWTKNLMDIKHSYKTEIFHPGNILYLIAQEE